MKMLTGKHWCCFEPCEIAAGIPDGQGVGVWGGGGWGGVVDSVATQHLAQGPVKPPYMRF